MYYLGITYYNVGGFGHQGLTLFERKANGDIDEDTRQNYGKLPSEYPTPTQTFYLVSAEIKDDCKEFAHKDAYLYAIPISNAQYDDARGHLFNREKTI